MLASLKIPPVPNLAADQLNCLRNQYVVTDDGGALLEAFGNNPAFYPLLADAVKPLRHSFGDRLVLQLRTQSTDEGNIFKAVVQLPAAFEGADKALCVFDEDWWLDNCQRSKALVVFDYELVNAF